MGAIMPCTIIEVIDTSSVDTPPVDLPGISSDNTTIIYFVVAVLVLIFIMKR